MERKIFGDKNHKDSYLSIGTGKFLEKSEIWPLARMKTGSEYGMVLFIFK